MNQDEATLLDCFSGSIGLNSLMGMGIKRVALAEDLRAHSSRVYERELDLGWA